MTESEHLEELLGLLADCCVVVARMYSLNILRYEVFVQFSVSVFYFTLKKEIVFKKNYRSANLIKTSLELHQ